MKTFLLLLLTLLSTSQCYARIQDDSKRWKVETSWEKKAVDRVPEDDRPWPLWIPKRREKTVIMRLSYGGGNKKRRVLESKEEGHDEEHEEEELSVEVLYEEICKSMI